MVLLFTTDLESEIEASSLLFQTIRFLVTILLEEEEQKEKGEKEERAGGGGSRWEGEKGEEEERAGGGGGRGGGSRREERAGRRSRWRREQEEVLAALESNLPVR